MLPPPIGSSLLLVHVVAGGLFLVASHQEEDRHSGEQNKRRADNGPVLKINFHGPPLWIRNCSKSTCWKRE